MKRRISKRTAEALKPGTVLSDDLIRGFVARRLPSGLITYGFRYRDAVTRKQHWLALGAHGQLTAEQARKLAQQYAGQVAERRNPQAELQAQRDAAKSAATNTLNAVLDAYLEREVNGRLRSADKIARGFTLYVRPRLGSRAIDTLRRSDINALLDTIADDHGKVQADHVLGWLRSAFNWHARRDDMFRSPIVKGMARTRPSERARQRVLDDQEIRDVWAALDHMDKPSVFPRIVRALLLTAQRRGDVADLHANEIDNRTWIIPSARYKTKTEHVVPLTDAALGQIGEDAKGYVFSVPTPRGMRPLTGFSGAKHRLDDAIAELRRDQGREPMAPWVLHDLRRTARSLMSRAGVSGEIAERVLGHKRNGVEKTYDRYSYLNEKREALERLATLIQRILQPPRDNVVAIPKAG